MAQAIPKGCEGLIPHLMIDGCAKALDFYKKAFGAVETMRMPSEDGKKIMHAEMKIGNKLIYLGDDFPEFRGKALSPTSLGGSPVTIHQYVEDCDAAINRALQAGATVVMPVDDMFWGDRYGSVADPFGHEWSFATHKRDLTREQMMAGMMQQGGGA